jgi:hypothetical protein
MQHRYFKLTWDFGLWRFFYEPSHLRSVWIIKYGGWQLWLPLTFDQILGAEYSVRYSRYGAVGLRMLAFGPVSLRHRKKSWKEARLEQEFRDQNPQTS